MADTPLVQPGIGSDASGMKVGIIPQGKGPGQLTSWPRTKGSEHEECREKASTTHRGPPETIPHTRTVRSLRVRLFALLWICSCVNISKLIYQQQVPLPLSLYVRCVVVNFSVLASGYR